MTSDIRKALLTLATALLLAAGLLLALWELKPALPPAPPGDALGPLKPLKIIEVRTAPEMARALDAAGVYWPPASRRLPAVIVAGLPKDIASLGADERSALFLRMVLVPAILANHRISRERNYLDTVTRHGMPPPASEAHATLTQLAERYDVTADLQDPATLPRLQRRIAPVPVELVLAVAALESGWGLSHFAVNSNALFGQWSGRVGQMPRQFERPDESIRHFMHTLNTHPAFSPWRQARRAGAALSELTETLTPWSPAHENYAGELQSIIRNHGLDQLPAINPVGYGND